MKPCPSCGFELFDYAQRCSNCGLRGLHNSENIPTKPIRQTERLKKGSVRKVGSGRKKGSHIFRIQKAIPKVLELKRGGVSKRQISYQTGLTLNTIRSILPPFYKHTAPQSIWETHSGLICGMRQERYSLQEIGDRVGRSRETIGQLLNKHHGSKCRICNAPLPERKSSYCSEKCSKEGRYKEQSKCSWRILYRKAGKPLPKSLIPSNPKKSPYTV